MQTSKARDIFCHNGDYARAPSTSRRLLRTNSTTDPLTRGLGTAVTGVGLDERNFEVTAPAQIPALEGYVSASKRQLLLSVIWVWKIQLPAPNSKSLCLTWVGKEGCEGLPGVYTWVGGMSGGQLTQHMGTKVSILKGVISSGLKAQLTDGSVNVKATISPYQ